MNPIPKLGQQPAKKQLNIWMIVSLILAIALIGVLANTWLKAPKSTGGDKVVKLSADAAASELIDFVNEVYGSVVGTATLKGVVEKNGLYEVTFSMLDNGVPTDQVVFTTPDAKLFIPQVMDIETMRTQFQDFQLQQEQIQAQQLEAVPEGSEIEPEIEVEE